MAKISVDFTKTTGKIKPMHGFNNGALTNNLRTDARHLFKEAGIPITRLHDCEYPFGHGEYVDIPCIFKNFDADVNDPASYNFTLTDRYIMATLEAGTDVMYRLGISIEHQVPKIHIFPPKDYKKWAEICEHIIMHYNEGWADGYHMGITYWEIWTEPNHCIHSDMLMWGSTAEEFAHFYDVAATHLKAKFPNLKIGGPAFSNPDSQFVEDFFIELTKDGNHPPMDFFSWHGYICEIEEAERRAKVAEDVLNRYGYSDAESIYDEYNYVKDWNDMAGADAVIHTNKGAAFNAALMCSMQNAHCDMLNYYGNIGHWNGLFEFKEGSTSRNGGSRPLVGGAPFYAFKFFNYLYVRGTQVELSSDDMRLYAIAATDGENSGVLVSSFAPIDEGLEDKVIHFTFKGVEGKTATVIVTDEFHNDKKLITFKSDEFIFNMPAYSIALIKFN